MELRWYQSECVSSFYDYFTRYNGNPVAALPTGCHAKGQGVLMFNGSVKRVEDVVVGDLLMGPDSTPRTVTALCRGRQEMRRIVPTKGELWVVNKDHILSLYRTSQNSEPKYECELPGVIEETVSQWEASSKFHKHIHKLYRVGVEFPPAKPVSLDPYFLGVFLGDGGCAHGSTGVTTADEVIYKWVTEYISSLGDSWRISHNGSKAITLHPTTGQKRHRMRIPQTTKLLKHLGLRHVACGDKFIPQNYKVGSRETRLKVLAGLLDTDGSLSCNGYDFVSKSYRLASDTAFVARSLGYAAYVAPCVKKSQLGTAGDYFRVSISGDLQELPLLLAYKKAKPRLQKKNVLVTGFKTEALPEADYYGFSLDGDCLYLLDDFTVTHNTGKSIVIAEFLRSMFAQWPFQRIIMATHVKELIRQNHDELLALWPQAPVGIFSAGLGQKNVRPITFGGIKSMVGKADLFGHVDLVLIDECHLVGPADDTSYHTFIADLKAINPRLKVVGLTATPYRLGQGLLTDVAHDREGNPMPPIFTDICYNITGRDSFNRLIAEGYLAPLVPKQTGTKLDVSNVAIRGGEFVAGELQKAVDREEITFAAIEETVQLGADRKHWLIFGTGETHCQHIVNALDSLGIPAAMVTSRTSDTDRDKHVADFKTGRIRALVNNNIFTAGFNFRPIDLICVLRPTSSPGLWVQMLGRGTRPADFKRDCLVLDFAGNTRRLGPINDPVLPKKRRKGVATEEREAPVKLCPHCVTWNHSSVRVCTNCKEEFPPPETKLQASAGTDALIVGAAPTMDVIEVDRVEYRKHVPHYMSGKPPTFKVEYHCGLRVFGEWICFDHEGFPRKKARDWWRNATDDYDHEPPESVDEAMGRIQELRPATHLRVWVNTPKPRVMACDYSGTAFGTRSINL